MMSLLLSAVAAVSMIAGCGNQAAGTSGEGNAPTSESREAGTDAAAAEETGERPTISIMCIDIYGSAMGNVGSRRRAEGGRGLYGCQCGFQLGSQRFL